MTCSHHATTNTNQFNCCRLLHPTSNPKQPQYCKTRSQTRKHKHKHKLNRKCLIRLKQRKKNEKKQKLIQSHNEKVFKSIVNNAIHDYLPNKHELHKNKSKKEIIYVAMYNQQNKPCKTLYKSSNNVKININIDINSNININDNSLDNKTDSTNGISNGKDSNPLSIPIHSINTISHSSLSKHSSKTSIPQFNPVYKGQQWPEDTTNTSNFSEDWKVRLWSKTQTKKHHEIYVFADTGASISACNSEYAHKHYSQFIHTRKSYLPVRVANGQVMQLKQYLYLPIYDKFGKLRFYHEFYLVPKLKNPFLASFYLLQKIQLPFPTDSPLLTSNKTLQKTKYTHPEEFDEHFGDCNNWDEPRLTTRVKQNDYSNDPHFQLYTNSNNTSNSPDISQLYCNSKDTRQIDAAIYEYEVLHHLTKFDFTRYKPQPIVTDPYHNKLKSHNLNNYTSFKNVDLNTLHAVKTNGVHIPTQYYSIKDKLCHISNYKASKQELEKAAKLADERTFNKVNLSHVKEISHQLYKRTTKLLYSTLNDLFAKNQSHTKLIPKYEFKIDLTPDAPDKIFIAQYTLSEEKRLVIIHHSQQNVKNGVFIADNKSPHNVPIIVIPKKPDRYRPAYALQHLNKFTKTVKSYIPTYDYIFEILRGPGLYSTTDLKNFFECINLRKKDRPLAHVTTPIGGFNLTRATYGFKNIMALAQDIGNYLVRPFHRAVAFVDDVIKKHAPNATPSELYNDIKELFTRAYEIGLLVNPEKTFLFCEEVEYLGYIFNQDGVIPRPQYIQKVLQFLPPKNKKEIQQYLAVLNYIARFLPNLAEHAQHINKLTHKNNTYVWGDEQQQAFEKIQKLVNQVPLLAHPTADGDFLVQTDASKYAMAAVLYQRQLNPHTKKYDWKIIEFYSKQFDKHLHDHPIMVKECLAITYALNHWQHFLLRKKFFVDTDHRNLISLYDSDEMKATNMKKKQMFVTMRNAISQFHFQIAHLKGTQIPLPDYLTRDGSTAYRDAPTVLQNPKLFQPKVKDKQEKQQLNLVFHYMQHIRQNEVQFPLPIRDFINMNEIAYNHATLQNTLTFNAQPCPLKNELIQERIKYMRHETPYNQEPLNRWLIDTKDISTSSKQHKQNDIFQIEKMQPIYAVPGKISCINTLQKQKQTQKFNPYKHVTFNLLPQPRTQDKDKLHTENKSILKNSSFKMSKKLSPLSRKRDYLFDKNKKLFDNYLDDVLETAFINRFHNQYRDQTDTFITSNSIADMYSLFEYTNAKPQIQTINSIFTIPHKLQTVEKDQNQTQKPNYFVDKFGKRRSQRKRKPPKKFYESFTHEKSETDKAQQKETTQNHHNTDEKQATHLTATPKSQKQKEREEKELKFKLSAKQSHELFKSLYNDLYQPDKLDSLLSISKLRIHQQNDPICQLIFDHLNNDIDPNDKRYNKLQKHYKRLTKMLQNKQFYINDHSLLCVKSTNIFDTDRIYVPTNLINVALHYVHKSSHFSHPGVIQTQQLVKQKFYWYRWQSDCRKFVLQCPECQKAKGHKYHKRGELAPINANKFNDIVHLDFLGPFHGALNVLIIVDNLTGYTMLVPTFGQTADDVILAIWNTWRPINGIPRKCLTDRGKGFIAELNQRFYKMCGIKGMFTSGYHAQTNAKAERRVQEAKKAIRLVNTTLNGEITEKTNNVNAVNSIKLLLPSIQFSLNQKPSTFSGISPNMLTRGSNLNDTIDVTTALQSIIETSKLKRFKDSHNTLRMLKHSLTTVRNIFNQHRWYYVANSIEKYNKHQKPDKLKIDDLVMYYVGERQYPMKKIRPRFTGPFRILNRVNHNTVTIYNEDTNEQLSCHTNKLKKYHPNQFTDEQMYLRQLKTAQKIQGGYRRKQGSKRLKV